MSESQAATVELLTAEVRVLMVGNRQITLSVFNQLDWDVDMEPFGRVTTRDARSVIGRSRTTGALVRRPMRRHVPDRIDYPSGPDGDTMQQEDRAAVASDKALPLIVLAGLR